MTWLASACYARVLIARHGPEQASAEEIEQLWKDIKRIVSKTLLAIHPFITSTYAACISSEPSNVGLPRNCFQVGSISHKRPPTAPKPVLALISVCTRSK